MARLTAEVTDLQQQLASTVKEEAQQRGVVSELQKQLSAEQDRLKDALQSIQHQKSLLQQSQREALSHQENLTGDRPAFILVICAVRGLAVHACIFAATGTCHNTRLLLVTEPHALLCVMFRGACAVHACISAAPDI